MDFIIKANSISLKQTPYEKDITNRYFKFDLKSHINFNYLLKHVLDLKTITVFFFLFQRKLRPYQRFLSFL